MRQSPWMAGIGITGLALFLGAAIAALIAKVPIMVVAIFGGFALLSGWCLLQALMEENVVTATGIRHRSLLGQRGFMAWADIERVQFRPYTKRIRLITARHRSLAVTGMMRGSQAFATAVLKHVSAAAIDPAAEKVLRALAAGNLEPVSAFPMGTPTAGGAVRSKVMAVVNVIGVGLGIGLGAYAGMSMLIPAAGAILSFRLVPVAVRQNDAMRASAIAAQGGLLLWLLVGAYALHSIQPVALDVVVLAVGIAWWTYQASTITAVGLLAFHAYVLIVNVQRLVASDVAEAAHRALVVHAVIHLFVMGLIGVWLWEKRGGRVALDKQ
jgi:hypothetical protein